MQRYTFPGVYVHVFIYINLKKKLKINTSSCRVLPITDVSVVYILHTRNIIILV